MSNEHKYFIVEASALPEVFVKVAEAKRLLSTGEASTVNEATHMTGISPRNLACFAASYQSGYCFAFSVMIPSVTGEPKQPHMHTVL